MPVQLLDKARALLQQPGSHEDTIPGHLTTEFVDLQDQLAIARGEQEVNEFRGSFELVNGQLYTIFCKLIAESQNLL